MTDFASAVSGPEVPTDEVLVVRILRGKTLLFELLMRRMNQRIYRTVRASSATTTKSRT